MRQLTKDFKYNGFGTDTIDPSLPYLVECCSRESIIEIRLQLEKENIPFDVTINPYGDYWIFIESKSELIEKAIACRNKLFADDIERLEQNKKQWDKNTFERLLLVNQILPTFGFNFQLEQRENGLYLSWDGWNRYKPERKTKRVVLHRNHYFAYDLPTGGTCTNAIAMLIRYVRNQPVYPLSVWEYWASDKIRIWKDPEVRDRCLLLLRESNWPRNLKCVFCDRDLTGKQWDWYDRPKEGIGCSPISTGKCDRAFARLILEKDKIKWHD